MKLFYRIVLTTINASLNYLKKSPSNKEIIKAAEDYYKAQYDQTVSSLKLVNSMPGKLPDLKLIIGWQFGVACQQIVRFPNLTTKDIFNNMLVDAGIDKEDRERLLMQFSKESLSLNLNEKCN